MTICNVSLPATMSSVFRQRGSSTDSTTAFSAGRIAQGKGRVVVVVSGYDSAAVYRGFAAQIAQLGYDDLGAPPLRNQKLADSPVDEVGFELPVPRA